MIASPANDRRLTLEVALAANDSVRECPNCLSDLERAESGDRSICPVCQFSSRDCSACGGQMWLEDGGRARLGLPRAEEIARAEAARCVTACPYCATMLGDHLRQLGSPVVVADLVELLAEALPESSVPEGTRE